MADSRSGAPQTLEVGTPVTSGAQTYPGTLSGPGTAFSGLTLTPDVGTDESTSGGLTSSRKTGYRVNSGSFTVAETAASVGQLLGRNGRRMAVRWRPAGAGSGRAEVTFEAIATISRSAAARGRREFSVELAIDGAVSRGTQ